MTAQEILEGNKLIYDFTTNNPLWWSVEDAEMRSAGQGQYPKFNQGWDWLMPVVEKIGDYRREPHEIIIISIVNGHTKIEGSRAGKIFRNSSIEGGMLNATWLACVDFIKWYNQNK